jgi:hypothetical protein
MALLKTALLIAQATEFAERANFVREDPAVAKAARTARVDVTQAVRSTSALMREMRAAWRGSAPIRANPAG